MNNHFNVGEIPIWSKLCVGMSSFRILRFPIQRRVSAKVARRLKNSNQTKLNRIFNENGRKELFLIGWKAVFLSTNECNVMYEMHVKNESRGWGKGKLNNYWESDKVKNVVEDNSFIMTQIFWNKEEFFGWFNLLS